MALSRKALLQIHSLEMRMSRYLKNNLSKRVLVHIILASQFQASSSMKNPQKNHIHALVQ